MTKIILLFFCLIITIGIAYGNNPNFITIDDFSIATPVLYIVISGNPSQLPTTLTSFEIDTTLGTSSYHILGGERDLALTLTYGIENEIASAGVYGTFNAAFPNLVTGYSLLQYDGIDNSIDVNTTGFTAIPGASTGVDILFETSPIKGTCFNFTYESDIQTSGMIYVFDIYGGLSYVECIFEATEGRVSTLPVSFRAFTGFADFAHVGSIEFYLNATENVDFILILFATH